MSFLPIAGQDRSKRYGHPEAGHDAASQPEPNNPLGGGRSLG
jgi:hypothetical protein